MDAQVDRAIGNLLLPAPPQLLKHLLAAQDPSLVLEERLKHLAELMRDPEALGPRTKAAGLDRDDERRRIEAEIPATKWGFEMGLAEPELDAAQELLRPIWPR